MTQPLIKVLQISQDELASFVSTELASTSLDGLNNVVLSTLSEGEALVYSGSPLEWRNVPSAQGLSGGDGITVTVGSPTALIAVDSSVARQDAINTFQQNNFFTATVSGIANAGVVLRSAVPGYILDMTGAGGSPDGKIWRMFASGNTLFYDVRNEASDTSANWLTVERTGIVVTSINFTADALTFNGVPIHTGSPIDSGGGGSPASAKLILDIQTSVGGSPAIGSPLGAYTLVLGDEIDKWIRLTASSIIVPPNATTAFTIGSQVTIFNISGAATTIAAGGSPVGTVIVNGVSSVDNDAGVAFIKVGTDEWDAV